MIRYRISSWKEEKWNSINGMEMHKNCLEVTIITPFNFPLEIPMLQLMGALYMGNKPLHKVDSKASKSWDDAEEEIGDANATDETGSALDNASRGSEAAFQHDDESIENDVEVELEFNVKLQKDF
ncbi:delta-1-pyrroline-5-carboxylate dehydrogenase 12a1 mitochondrial [Phtheirospermum japonicum]|uniref:Delta-1-pyrroline-5-carboxylate dehydrogenase 12a1 mitochondrial n=1 Tax=Phtheirospermum japonicum TaxID=374723 RepID=A0A830BV89_9LAMI|nr:delta-1-pyrroline-5-carboxylate dehydrogenase 12a1 mitochondrial [Phtheirospermum japonicum]